MKKKVRISNEQLAINNYYSGSQESEVCPMPHAPCPMPYARRVPHVTEKGYNYQGLPIIVKAAQ